MSLALSPADQHAITQHAQLLLLMLSGSVVLRGHVTAWMLQLADLLLTDTERKAQQRRVAQLLPAPPRRRLPRARHRKARRAS